MPEIDRSKNAIEARALWEGIAYGLLAGAVFLAVQVIVAVRAGGAPLLPMRWFASVVLGTNAFLAAPSAVLVIGMAVHLALSAAWGIVYAVIAAQEPPALRQNWLAQLGLGALFGLVVWAIDFVLLARLFWVWLLGLPLGTQLGIHVVFFGVPLGLLYGISEHALGASAPE